MDMIFSIITSYIIPSLIFIALLAGLYLIIDSIFVRKNYSEAGPIAIVMIALSTIAFVGIQSGKDIQEESLYSERTKINHGFLFKTLQEPLKDYPNAKCFVKFATIEKTLADNQQTKDDKEDQYYLDKDCHEFKQKILDSNSEILNEIKEHKIEKNAE